MTARRSSFDTKTAPSWRRYLRFWRADLDRDTDEELRLHLELRVEELVAGGFTPDAARERAASEFGDIRETREHLRAIDARLARRQRSSEHFGSVRDDLRYTFRSLRRTPAFFAAVLITMTLGLGVNASMFSFLDDVFFRPPAGVTRPGSLRRLWSEFNRGTGAVVFWGENVTYPDHRTITEALERDAAVALYVVDQQRVGHGGDAPMARVAYVTTNYFSVLGAGLSRGRMFIDAENQFRRGVPVAVVSEAFRDRQLGTGGEAIGATIRLGGKPYTVIGVGATGFTGPDLDAVDVWLPLATAEDHGPNGEPWWQSRSVYAARQIMRLRPGVDERALAARLTTTLQAAHRAAHLRDTTLVIATGPINSARGPGTPDSNVTVATRLAGVALVVLLIACANVVNLLLARAYERRREIAIRMALGVSRARLVRLMLTESLMLAVLAGAMALLAAYWGGALLRHLLLPTTQWGQSPLGSQVIALSVVAAIIAGLAVGLVPAVQSSNADVTSALKSGGHEGSVHRSKVRASLVGVQAALAMVLLVAAVLFVTSLRNVRDLDIGYDADRLVFAGVTFDEGGRPPSAVQGAAYRQIGRSSPVRRESSRSRSRAWHRCAASARCASTSAPTRSLPYSPIAASFRRSPRCRHRISARLDCSFSRAAASHRRLVAPGRIASSSTARWRRPHGAARIRLVNAFALNRARVLAIQLPESWRTRDSIRRRKRRASAVLSAARSNAGGGLGRPRDDHHSQRSETNLRSHGRRQCSPPPTVPQWYAEDQADGRVPRAGLSAVSARCHVVHGVRCARAGRCCRWDLQHGVVRRESTDARIWGANRAWRPTSRRGHARHQSRAASDWRGNRRWHRTVTCGGRFISSLLYGIAPSDPRTIAIVTAVLIAAGVAASFGPAWRAGRADPASVLRDD